jgi:hypothetical protein
VPDPRATIDAYFAGVNEERYDDVAALFAPGATLTAPGVGPLRPDEIAAYLAAVLKAYPKHRDDPTRIVLAASTATVEIRFTGEFASGAPIAFDALDVFDFDDVARITRLTTWFDSQRVRANLERPDLGTVRRELAKATPIPLAGGAAPIVARAMFENGALRLEDGTVVEGEGLPERGGLYISIPGPDGRANAALWA